MAVTVDSVSNATAASGTNTRAWSHTLGGGSNLLLLVGIASAANPVRTVSSVTYGAQSLAQVPSSRQISSVSGFAAAEWWYVKAPSGNQTITVTLSGNAEIYCGAVVMKDVDQTTPLGTAATTQTTGIQPLSATLDVSSGTTEAAVGLASQSYYALGTITATSGVERWNLTNGSGSSGAEAATITGSATAAFAWTIADTGSGISSIDWVGSGVSVKPASAAAAGLANIGGSGASGGGIGTIAVGSGGD